MKSLIGGLALALLFFGGRAKAQLLAEEQHPRLAFAATDIPLLQERILREPYASWWQTILARAESPPATYANDRAKVRQAKSLAFVYVVGGGEKVHARAAVQLLREVAFPPRGGDMGEPHLEGDVVALYATTYDMLHPFLQADPDALAEIREILAEEANRLYRGIKIDFGILSYRLHDTPHLDNWHLRVYGGLGLAAWALAAHEGAGGSGPADWAGRAFEVVTRTLDYQIEAVDGGFAEGPFYARYAADLYLPYLLALKNITGIDLFADPKVQRLHRWMLNLRLPNGRRPNIEDGHLDDFYGNYLAAVDAVGGVHRWDWENNERGAYVREFAEMDAIAFYDDRVLARPPDWGPTVFMPGAGDAVMRSDWSADATYMLLRGEHGRVRVRGLGHEHPDETSFILFAGREMLALDAGYINFPNHHKVNAGRNHNLVLINGEGPPLYVAGDVAIGGGNDAYLENFYATAFMDYAEVRAHYAETDVRRRVMFIDKRYFVIADQLNSAVENLYEWRLHGNGGGSSGGAYRRDNNAARWTRDRAELLVYLPELEGRVFAERDTIHSFEFRQELTHTALRVLQEGREAEFLAVLYPRSLASPEPVFTTLHSRGGQAMAIAAEEGRDIIWLRQSSAGKIEIDTGAGLIASDALFGLLRIADGRPQAWAIRAGGVLEWGGKTLVAADGAIDLSLAIDGNRAAGFVRGSEAGFKLSIELNRRVDSFRFAGAQVDWDAAGVAVDLSGAGTLELELGPERKQNTAVATSGNQPRSFALYPNWPNPFNSATQIRYELATGNHVRLEIYDLVGQRISSLVSAYRVAGNYQVRWDGRDQRGERVGTGMYLVRLYAGSEWAARKLILLR